MEENNFYSNIHAKMASKRVIFLKEELTKEVASTIAAWLIYYDFQDPDKEIYFYIHTNGGDVSAFFNIYDVMNFIKAPVVTICVGKAFSAGAFLLCSGSKRYMYKNAKVMIHGIQFHFPNPYENDQVASETFYKFIINNNNNLAKLLSAHTKQPLDKIKTDTSRDLFLSSDEALKYGIVDKII